MAERDDTDRPSPEALLEQVNREHRGQDKPTNVLSFPLIEGGAFEPEAPGAPLLLGDVVLAWGTVAREAAAQGKSISAHAVPNTPKMRAAVAVSLSTKLSTSLGRMGMIMPSASMSSRMVTKMKATAALREAPVGVLPAAPACCGSPVMTAACAYGRTDWPSRAE